MSAKKSNSVIKKSMQNVKFRHVDELLEFLPESERELVEFLRELVYSVEPQIKEKLSFSVPFFSLRKTICLIWPASVYWGSKKTFDGVQFGFTYGVLLDDHWKYFAVGNRKQMTVRVFQKSSDVNTHIVKQLLINAVELDSIR